MPMARIPSALAASDRHFYTGMAVAIALTTLAGFGPTFYLARLYEAPPLPLLLALHGTLFTGWILLLLTQAASSPHGASTGTGASESRASCSPRRCCRSARSRRSHRPAAASHLPASIR